MIMQNAVITTKLLSFAEPLSNAINGSILEYENGYLLVFRDHTSKKLCKQCPIRRSEIQMVVLDQHFNQNSPIQTITPLSAYCPEDPRLHKVNGNFFVTYNDEPYTHAHHTKSHEWLCRRVFTGKLDPIKATLSDIREVPSPIKNLRYREKNWVPFEYQDNLHFIYATDPYTIFNVQDIKDSRAAALCNTKFAPVYNVWDQSIWGPIFGGTPARLVDDVYIAFFHAWKKCPDKKNLYYVMGAYAFEPNPPFKILAITPEPIFFKDAYSAKHAEAKKHILYPAGFAIEKKENKTILHVSCGENDSSTRIVSIDKDRLLATMVLVP